ncbi:MAG: signal peptidase II [Candidatus Margulisbacteria bacterium]|nr:signal peptidase II [Candidatus Margulisiibacteriota bacterium]
MTIRHHKILIGSLIFLDQLFKFIAQRNLTFYTEVSILPGVSFIKVHNFGAAYGILQNFQGFLIGISFTVLLMGWIYRHQLVKNRIGYIGLSIIASGAVGNLIDRIVRGYVVDFIDIHIIPVFNLADLFINLGILCLVIDTLKASKKNDLPAQPPQ